MAPSISPIIVSSSPGDGWTAVRQGIDAALSAAAVRAGSGTAAPVADAVAYALAGGGKRMRGILLILSYRACGGTGDASTLAAAVEIIHTYSLVHDDLPCMDDDDIRRGRPTVHRAFDPATAMAAGIAMVPLSVAVALDGTCRLGLEPAEARLIVATLMRASGAGGMVGGQVLDLLGEGRSLSVSELERIHRGKTGALMAAAAAVGGIAARARPEQVAALERFGASVGLAFQIADDILDATGTTEVLGKPAGRDADLRKSTYVARMGVKGARTRAAELIDGACEALAEAGILTTDLEYLSRLIVERES